MTDKEYLEESNRRADIQKQFDASVDAHDMPSGATSPKNEFAGD